ncbi:hypothetical protein SPRG_04793 [Saprolegnia parasitica CBS 223.65]|uniref:Chromo domain-containing protein n=1 Tax=Saprolegnia parasitica (strain CBS 223.65) TaxID=695850 RepID=A0A067CNS2_SAPPC|nr:hypothetical protein SPRG_04793 [Saprolegnia parasitica CBS 223.65]KDO30890.1 hypothetical protein SPRG_04793 [Saprolegnia parasitica CBS 223.65]|eukprot:XP_012198584.1 hypothetical protein SPRG_04793 [Saprolegnia parasitica CBS 223.65]
MATSIERILGRKTERGRVHYLVRWEGHGPEHDTWESRIDLREDGHFEHIRVYERMMKDAKETSTPSEGSAEAEKQPKAEAKPRGRSRSTKSKSPSRARSRSVSKKDTVTSPRGRSKSRGNSVHRERKKRTPVETPVASETSVAPEASMVLEESKPVAPVVVSTLQEETPVEATPATVHEVPKVQEVVENIFADAPVARGLPSLHTATDSANDADDENDIFNKEAVAQQIQAISSGEYDNLSKVIDALRQRGWLYRFIGFLVVFLAMLANVLVPEIEKNFAISESSNLVLSILTKTNSLPPLICLVLVLHGRSTKSLSKWIAICLVWRTAAEVVTQLPDTTGVYATVVAMCIAVADLSAFLATCSCVGGHCEDIFTQTLCVMGFLLLLAADCIFFLELLHESSARFLVMAFGAMILSFSSVLAEADDA